MTKQFRALVCAAALAVPMSAVPSSAQGPVVGVGNLVNVQVVNVANNNEIIKDVNVGVGVAAGIAAAVCDVTVQLVTVTLAQGDNYSCPATASGQRVDITQR